MKRLETPLALGLFLLASCATAGVSDATPAPAQTDTAPSVPAPAAAPAPSASTGADAGSDPECKTAAECKPPTDSCTTVACRGGACAYETLADRASCDNGFGQCISGKCEKLESCFGDSPMEYLHCGGGQGGERDASTSLYPTSRVSTYACASGEIAPEVAFQLDPDPGAQVTVSLAVTGGADADLDLLVLEADCNGTAACAGSGLTAGTGTETASFTAKAGRKYYVVVDGKVATPVSFHVAVDCR